MFTAGMEKATSSTWEPQMVTWNQTSWSQLSWCYRCLGPHLGVSCSISFQWAYICGIFGKLYDVISTDSIRAVTCECRQWGARHTPLRWTRLYLLTACCLSEHSSALLFKSMQWFPRQRIQYELPPLRSSRGNTVSGSKLVPIKDILLVFSDQL